MNKDKKIKKVMGEYKRGKLKSSSGKKVKDKDQAMAIAMSEARKGKKMAAGGAVKASNPGKSFNVQQLSSMLQSGGLGQAQMADAMKALQAGAARQTTTPAVKKATMAPGAPMAKKAYRGGGMVMRDGCARKGRTKGRYI